MLPVTLYNEKMKFSQEFIQDLKNRLPLSSVLSRYIKLIPAGSMRYKALCPFHNEKTPSLVVSDDRGSYHCFGCGAHGDIVTFVREHEQLDFIESVKVLAEQAGMALPKAEAPEIYEQNQADYQIFAEFTEFFKAQLAANQQVLAYLKKRNIPPAMQQRFALGYAPNRQMVTQFVKQKNYQLKKLVELGLYKQGEYGEPYFLFAERLIFPIANHYGKIVAFGGRVLKSDAQPKYLNSPEHKFFKKRELLFNFAAAKQQLQKTKQALVCEGYMDVLKLEQYGFTNAVAALGTAFSETHLQILWQQLDVPILCFDGDEAGRRAMLRAANIALPLLQPGKSLRFLLLPEGKDPDDILENQGGAQQMQQLITEALPLAQIIMANFLRSSANLPEERAKISADLQQQAEQISDATVKAQYKKFFREGFYNFYREQPYYKQNRVSTNNMVRNEQGEEFLAEELEIIIFFCCYPEALLAEDLQESLALLEFTQADCTSLQNFLLERAEEQDIAKSATIFAEQNLNANFYKIFNGKLQTAKIIAASKELDLKNHFLYLSKKLSLVRQKAEYKKLILTEDAEQQKLAIALKHDIKMLEQELRNYLEQ